MRRFAVPALILLLAGCATTTEAVESDRAKSDDGVFGPQPVTFDHGFSGPFATLPKGITSFGAAVSGDAIYVAGGYSGEPHSYSKAGQNGDLLRMKADGSWEQLAGFEPAQSVVLVPSDGGVIRIGGLRAENEAGTPADLFSVSEVAAYDAQSNGWTELPPMPDARSSHNAVRIGDRVVVIGGWTLAGAQSQGVFHNTALILDLSAETPTWEEIKQPFEVRAHAIAAHDGKVYALGGMGNHGPTSEVWVFDPSTKSFEKGVDFPGMGFGLAALGVDEGIVASGMDGTVRLLQDGAWTDQRQLVFSRFFHQFVDFGGTVWALGGISGMAAHDRVLHIEPALRGEVPKVALFELDNPGPVRNRQGLAIVGESVLSFGGNNSLGQHDFAVGNFLAKGQALALPSMTWRDVADYPVARQSMRSVFIEDPKKRGDDKWLFIGGFGHQSSELPSPPPDSQATTQREAYVLDPKTGDFSPVPGLSSPRSQFGLFAHNGELWVMGGLDYDPTRPGKEQFQHRLEVLHAPAVGEPLAETKFKIPRPRRAFGGALMDGKIYLVGGMREEFKLVDDACDVFDLETKKWSTITCPEKTRLNPEMVAMGGKLYLAGGSVIEPDQKGPQGATSIEAYDPASDTWSTVVETLPFQPKHMRMVEHDGRLMAISTHSETGKATIAFIWVD